MSETSIVIYDGVAEQIDTATDMANFIPDVTTKEGYEKSKRVSLDVGKMLTALEKKRKEKKSKSLQEGRDIDSFAVDLAEKLKEIQEPHKVAYQDLDIAKKQRETDRKAKLEERVNYIRTLPELLAESSSDEIQGAMQAMANEECLDFYEYSSDALKARNATREALALLFTKKDREESDAIELVILKKQQAEREQKEREDRIAAEAKQEAEAVAAKAIKAKEDAKQAEELAKKQAEESEKARIESEKQSKLAAIEAEKVAKARAEEAAKQAKLAEIDKQEASKKKEAEELAKREADKKHIGAVRGAAKDDLIALGLDEKSAKEIVLAISNGKIKNVSIQY